MPLDPHPEVNKTTVVEAGQDPLPAARAHDLEALATGTPASIEPGAHHAAPHNHADPRVGSTIKHYELLRMLGEGGMGAVYLARDTVLGRLVAIKVLQMHAGPSAERFLIEAQATARCRHDNIVVIHEVGQLDGYLYMVLEYLEGRTLREWMAQRERLAGAEPPAETDASPGLVSPSLAVELMLPVVRALACAHQLGIVHRDLKPENIFLTEAGRVVVLDFGIAKRLEASDISALNAAARPLEPDARLTQEGTLLGTLPYMSPEQLRSEDVDPRSDLWAVGILLYELVTGAHPLSHCSIFELLDNGESEEPMPRVGDKRPDVGTLGAIIDQCLHKPRDRRYRSAEELLAVLEALARDRVGHARAGWVMSPPRELEAPTIREGPPPTKRPAAALRPGTVLAGRYRIRELLGEGGMGVVYRAHDLTLELDIALKILHPMIAHDPEKLALFRNEVRVARMVTHPNVCRLHDLEEQPDGCFITMEYIAGESLAARLEREGMKLPEMLRVLRDVASGLAAAHAAGVIHRDLKPSNVLLAGDHAIIVDFGIAGEGRALGEGPQDIAGTRGYMAPEQMTGAPIDPRVDVYAFGVLAFVLTTGRRPPLAATHTVPNGGPAAVLPATEIAPHLEDLPAGLAALIADCLAPPEGRPRDATEVLRRLDAAAPRRGLRWKLPLLVAAMAATAAIVVVARQRGEPPQGAPTAPRIVLPAVDGSALAAEDRWLGPAMQRILADELIDAWGLEVELGGTPISAPGSLVVTSRLAREPSGRLHLALDGTTLEADTTHELAVAAAARLVTGHVPKAAQHPTAAELAEVGAHDPEAWRLWRRAEHEALLARVKRASELCRQALARDPTFPVASLELAMTHSYNAPVGELAHAAALMDQVPVAPLYRLELTVARRVNDGNFIGAALAAQELLQLDLTPRQRLTMELRWVTARIYLMRAPLGSITPDLLRLTERYPDHPAAFKMLAENYQRSDQPTAPTLSLRYATRAAELDPGDAETHTYLATALLLVGRRDEARARAAELDRLDPEDKRYAAQVLFALHMALGDLAAAEIDARRMLAGTPTEHAEGMRNLAQIDVYWGRFDDGLRGLLASADEFDAAGASWNWAGTIRSTAGRYAWWLGDRVTARAAFERLVDYAHHVPMVGVRALIAADKLDDARARAAEFPDGSLDRAAAELAIADAVHDAAGVLAAFARIEQLSTMVEHLFAVAVALERTGRPDDAAAMYERLVNHVYSWREPIATVRAWSRLGHLRERAGDIAGARAAFAEVIRRWGHATARIPEVDDARRQLRALRGR